MKKLSVVLCLCMMLALIGCGKKDKPQGNENVVPVANQEVVQEQPQDDDTTLKPQNTSDLGVTIHGCLMGGGGEACEPYLDPANKDKYGEMIEQECASMPGMADCQKYAESIVEEEENVEEEVVEVQEVEEVPEVVEEEIVEENQESGNTNQEEATEEENAEAGDTNQEGESAEQQAGEEVPEAEGSEQENEDEQPETGENTEDTTESESTDGEGDDSGSGA